MKHLSQSLYFEPEDALLADVREVFDYTFLIPEEPFLGVELLDIYVSDNLRFLTR